MIYTNHELPEIKLRVPSLKSNDMIEGNSSVIILDRTNIHWPWPVVVEQLHRISEANDFHILDSKIEKSEEHKKLDEMLQKSKEPLKSSISKPLDKSNKDLTEQKSENPLVLAQILMWLSLPAVLVSSVAIIAAIVVVVLSIMWIIFGIVVPYGMMMGSIGILIVSALIAGPLVIYSEHLEDRLNTEYIKDLEDQIKNLGGTP